MKRLLLICICLTSSATMTAQDFNPDSLWHDYVQALQADLVHKQKQDKQEAAAKKQAQIKSNIFGLSKCLQVPYTEANCKKTLADLEVLRKDTTLTTLQIEEIDYLEKLILDYKNQASLFCKIFAGEINDNRFKTLKSKSKEELTPGQIKIMTNKLNESYNENGLELLSFDLHYVYLNQKLHTLRESLYKLQNDKVNPNEMYDLLVASMKIESELSTEHKTYHLLQ